MEPQRPSAGAGGERAQALALLDAVFVAPGARNPSFAERFPAVLAGDGTASLLTARRAGRVAACVAVKLRPWDDGHGLLAMVGGVCTDPAYRGQGLATHLLHEAEAAAAGVADLVLWTTQPGFYERRGWMSEDAGRLGTLRGVPAGTGEVRVLAAADAVDDAEAIRARWAGGGVRRRREDYRTVPFPARWVECVIAGAGDAGAYALLGVDGASAYVYEVVGDPGEFLPLWSDLARRHVNVRINDRPGTGSWAWLEAHATVDWTPAPLALWKGRRREYVPYLDRI